VKSGAIFNRLFIYNVEAFPDILLYELDIRWGFLWLEYLEKIIGSML